MAKDKAAVALGRKRWDGVSAKDRSEAMAAVSAGRSKISSERRKEIARLGAAAKHAKKAAKTGRKKS